MGSEIETPLASLEAHLVLEGLRRFDLAAHVLPGYRAPKVDDSACLAGQGKR